MAGDSERELETRGGEGLSEVEADKRWGGVWGGGKKKNPTVDKKKNEIREGWKGRKAAAGGPWHCGGGS